MTALIDAYRIGISIGLNGNVARIIEDLAKQFGVLDKAIQRTQGEVNTLVSGMRKIANEGKQAAAAWQQAAQAMERAARAGRTAASAAGRSPAGGMSAGAAGAAAASVGIAANAQRDREEARRQAPPPRQLPYYGPSNRPTPYARIQDFSTGRVYEGEVIPPSGAGGGPGGLPAARGPTIGGTAARPGAATYGPYGPGPGVPYGPGGGGPGGPGGGGGGLGGGGGRGGRGGGSHGYHSTAAEMAIPAYLGGEFIKNTYEAGSQLSVLQARLRSKGFDSDELIARATEQAYRLQREVKPTRVSSNMQLLADLQQVVQNPEEALSLAPDFAKLSVAMSQAGHAGGESELMAAIKAGEYRGVLTGKANPATGEKEIDTSKLKSFINNLLTTYTTFGISPSDELGFLRASGYTGAVLSDESFFANQIALHYALGSRQAGTALRGFEQQFASGKMGTASANLLLEMGILQGGGTVKTNPYVRKNGPFNVFIDPRAYPEGMKEEISLHPEKFISEYLFPKIDEYLAKKLGKQYTEATPENKFLFQVQEAGQLASSQTGAKEIAEIMRIKALIERDAVAREEAMRRDNMSILTTKNPAIAASALGSSVNAFETALGQAAMEPAIKALDTLTGVLNKFTQWAQHNPEQASRALEGLAIAVGMFAVGSAASIALAVLTGKGGIIALAGGIEALGHSLTSIPGWLINMATGAAVGARVGGLPGAAVGAVAGGAVSAAPGLLEFTNRMDEEHPWLGAIDRHYFGGRPNAPVPQSGNFGASPGESVPVHITNPHDLSSGIAGGLSNNLNRPPSGLTGHDSSMDAVNAMYGGIP